MNIWFVSIFENTPIDDNQNTRYNSLVNEAIKRGHSVTFWASTFRHNVKKQRYDDDTTLHPKDRLTLRFLKSKPYSKNISLKRWLSHRDYAERLIEVFEECHDYPDLIMMAYPPISVAEKISTWAKHKNIPIVVDIIDPWPDVFIEYFPYLPKALILPFRPGIKKMLRRVTAVTAISNQYIDWAKMYYSKLNRTKCFYPAIQFEQMQKELERAKKNVDKKTDQFTVIYAGSLGYSYDIPTILNAAEELEQSYGNKIHFIIAGDGPQKNLVEQYETNHENLKYVGRVPKTKLMEYYYKSDLGMTQHIKGATQSVTYKLFDLLGCGIPILNSLESEMKNIILENDVGLHNEPGNIKQLVRNIINCLENPEKLDKMSLNAIELTKKLGDSEKVYAETMDFLESLEIVREDVIKA